MAGLHVPLSTLRRRPHGRRRMTRGHRGSLLLRCRAFSSLSSCRFIPAHPTFHAKAADQTHVAYMPDTTWPIDGHPPGSSRAVTRRPGFDVIYGLRHFTQRSSSWSPPDVSRTPFPTSLTTTVFSQRSMWWFGTSPRRAVPKGHTFIFRAAPHHDALPT